MTVIIWILSSTVGIVFKDMGTVVMGKVESGVVTKGQNLLLMPNKVQNTPWFGLLIHMFQYSYVSQTPVQAIQLWSDDDETDEIGPGENVKIKLKGVEEDAVMSGFVLCSTDNFCKVGRIFDAQVKHFFDTYFCRYNFLMCTPIPFVYVFFCTLRELSMLHKTSKFFFIK